jgi:hypothetical protein
MNSITSGYFYLTLLLEAVVLPLTVSTLSIKLAFPFEVEGLSREGAVRRRHRLPNDSFYGFGFLISQPLHVSCFIMSKQLRGSPTLAYNYHIHNRISIESMPIDVYVCLHEHEKVGAFARIILIAFNGYPMCTV